MTEEQTDSQLGFAAQRAAIVVQAEWRGWHLVEVIEDAGPTGKGLNRPGMALVLGLTDKVGGQGSGTMGSRCPPPLTERLPGLRRVTSLGPRSAGCTTRAPPGRGAVNSAD